MDHPNPVRRRSRLGRRRGDLVRVDGAGLHPHLTVAAAGVMLVLAACGDDNGGNDTLFTGLSGVVLVVIVAVAVIRWRNR